jgi:hypothetical protein
MIRPFQPGNAGRPPNTSTKYSETLALARQASPEAMKTLIARLHDEDGRVAILAAVSVLERAFGRVKEMRTEELQSEARVDLSKLSREELDVLVALVDRGGLQPPETPSELQIEAQPDPN